jgi:Integron Cassette Protein Hfx_Cass5
MDRDDIAEIGFDEQGRLFLKPLTASFPYIDREAMGISWDDQAHCLCAPPPPGSQAAPVAWWLRRLFAAARAQDCELRLAPETRLHNIPYALANEVNSVLMEHRA